MDISDVPNVEEGDVVMANVHAVLGSDKDVGSAVVYKKDAGTISFTCKGATLTYSCPMNGSNDMQILQ